jgi:hypothetical protein
MSIKVCKLTEWGPLFAQKYSSCMGSEVMVASCIWDSADADIRPAGNGECDTATMDVVLQRQGHPRKLFSLPLLKLSYEKNKSYPSLTKHNYARNPSFSPFFFASRINPCLCFASAPIDLQNSPMTCKIAPLLQCMYTTSLQQNTLQMM